ncbi:PREDICTED: uncharacterized protein LOC108767927 isoform X2 [Trachymyrmex cornetzi]|uniref:uncharacterized protein LOC108767927 isoform X2 n=1 Tax=Trachymyrmex cornetzi TaxID=471704 RepID=UPI00084ED923|nr:PREDICTED: uncharacterized protein LOC108767927 isoform X2 [Trachymyrmex cornetzi]
MEIIPGKRKDSLLYVYQGYTYNLDKRYTHIFRCAKRRITLCSGILIKKNETFLVQREHNHPSDPNTVHVFNLKKQMIEMCKETTATNKDIFDTVSRQNPVAAANISFSAVRSLLLREKNKVRPSLPKDISDFHDFLQHYGPTKYIYKACAISEDNKYSYIFSSDKLLKILEKSCDIFMDGTFAVIPSVPKFAQLFSIHARYMDKGIAVLFILCEARTQSVYKSIWKEIVKLAPDLQHNVRFIMMDYEKASMNAVHEQFPEASLRGCWFHYYQAVLRKWKQLGLVTAPDKVLSMAIFLALAPSEMFSEGLNLMQTIVDKECNNYPNLLLFMNYMRNTWLPISEKVSVYGCAVRTNNLESFHNVLLKKMRTTHPNFWIFLNNIAKLITDQEITHDRVINGLQVSKNRCWIDKFKNAKIQKAQNYLSTGIYSLNEFLQFFDKENLHKQYQVASLINDSNEVDIYDNLHKKEADIVASISTKDLIQTINDSSNNVFFENDPLEPEVLITVADTNADLYKDTICNKNKRKLNEKDNENYITLHKGMFNNTGSILFATMLRLTTASHNDRCLEFFH